MSTLAFVAIAAGVAAIAWGLATVIGGLGATGSNETAGLRQIPVPRSPVKLLGQRIMVTPAGATADAGLLRAVRAGRVGGVILFTRNIVSGRQLTAMTRALQYAARRGGNPPLLIAVDQEGGEVKRLAGGPPSLSPPQITATGSVAVSAREGAATGRYLRGLGINLDLAPVLDVPTFAGAFIARQGRAFSIHADTVAKYATAFALGLQREHVAATAKHFPGLGSAAVSTDNQRMELRPTAAQRRDALRPYRTLIGRGLDAVMLSTAGFPAYDATGAPAALSSAIAQGLLRSRLGFRGMSITDALGSTTGHDEIDAGVLAARAGADVLLYTDDPSGELPALESALRRGRIDSAQAAESYRRIVALKRLVAGA
ncbi:MAG: glycoside hydrolase family 3 N-terminal domain-containing protein [Solirubrobacteraceae bacterium]